MSSGASGAFQPGFGQDEFEGGGGIAHGFANAFPVFRLGGKLVTGDNRPFVHVDGLIGGEKKIGTCTPIFLQFS